MPALLILSGILLIGLFAWIGHQQEMKRREVFQELANQHGWTYTFEKDRFFDEQFGSLPFVGKGSNRYLHHMFTGRSRWGEFRAGEYHYQVTRRNGKNRSTHHYYSTVVMLKPSFPLQELSIRPEGMFDRLKAAFGWDDIDFASAEFSRQFHVSAPNRDWAFAFVQPRSMEILMQTSHLEFHIRNGWLVIRRSRQMEPGFVSQQLEVAEALLAEVPSFLHEGHG